MNGKWKAHLYMKKMRLSFPQKSQVLTGTLGEYTVEAIQKSALHSIPSIKESGGGFRPGGPRTYNSSFKPRKGGGKGGRKGGKSHKVHEVDQEEDEYTGRL